MLCQYAPYFWLFLKLCKSSHFLLQPVPIVYGSSSNLLSVRGKKNLLPRKCCKYLHCSPALFCLQKKKGILWNHGGIESPSLAHSFSLPAPKQQLSSSDLSPWRPAGYFGLYFPADCSRFLPHSQALRLLRVAGKGLTVDSLLDPQMDGQESVSCSK